MAGWDNGDEMVAPAPAQRASAWDNGDEVVSPPPAAAPGYLEAGARGAAQGATLGLADEIYAAGAGTRSWMEGRGFSAGYDKALADYRGGDKAAEEAHPYVTGGSKIAGGVAATVPAMVAAAPAALPAAAAGLGGRMLAGAATGAGLGAVQGFNEGEGGFTNRGEQALYGLGGGAAAGAVAAPIASAVGAGVRYGADFLPQRAAGLGTAATREATKALQEAGPQAVQQRLAELGPDATLIDAAQPFLGRAQGLAATPGAPGERIVSTLAAGDAGTDARLASGLDAALGPAPVPSQVEAQFAAKRAATGPMYEWALGSAPAVDTTEALAEIGARLNTAAGPERAALLRTRDILTEQGPNGIVPRTDPRYLHNAKGALDQLIDYGDSTIGVPRGALSREDGAVSAVRSRLNGALEAQVPGYADANLAFRTAARASEALESGGKALGGGDAAVHPADFAADLARRPIEQQAALRAGIRADLDRTVGNRANDLTALSGEFQRPADWNRAKLAAAYGPEAVEQAARSIDANAAMRQSFRDVAQGSQSAQRLRGAEAMGVRDVMPGGAGGAGVATLAGVIGGPSAAAVPIATKAGKIGLNIVGRASDRARNEGVADILTRQGDARDAAVQALVDALTTKEGRLASIGPRTSALVQSLITSGDRNTGGAQRARRLGAMLLAQ